MSELDGFMSIFCKRTFPGRGVTHNLIAYGWPRKPKTFDIAQYHLTIHSFLPGRPMPACPRRDFVSFHRPVPRSPCAA
jgi:hypothetical protein